MLSDGLLKFSWLNTLKKSAENPSLNRSLIAVVLPNRISKFQNGSPYIGLALPVRPLEESWT